MRASTRSTIGHLALFAALASTASTSAHSQSLPVNLVECEGRDASVCGTWTFSGTSGVGRWRNGAIATLEIERTDSAGGIIVHRADTTGVSAGLTATYSGTVVGQRLEGTVTWTSPGLSNDQASSGSWYATLVEDTVPHVAPPVPGATQPETTIESPASPPSPPAPPSSSPVDMARAFLDAEPRGREILMYLHFMAAYHGHELQRVVPLPEEHQFMLVYRFHWEDDGFTDLAFLCDPGGRVNHIQVLKTNARFNQPFFLAGTSIKGLGKLVVDHYKDGMNAAARKAVEWAIDRADAKSLLEWTLAFQQAHP